jgi:F-type H+-transporting ATPase subunit delta
VILEEKVDPELIGGIVLTVGDKQVDASIKAQLDKLRRGFDRNLFVSEL